MILPIIEVFHDETEASYSCRLTPCGMPVELYGVILHDVARQVAKMYAREGGFSEDVVLAAILNQFDAERSAPSSDVYVKKLDS